MPRRASSLVHGVKRQQREIDTRIAECAEHWDLDRMAVVDRNILRLAAYELLFEPAVPGKVTINEAIEIAKKFGTAESSRFINGVLDRIHRELRPAS
jgi:N utilization substance protein B